MGVADCVASRRQLESRGRSHHWRDRQHVSEGHHLGHRATEEYVYRRDRRRGLEAVMVGVGESRGDGGGAGGKGRAGRQGGRK